VPAQHVLDLPAHGRIGLSAVRGLWKIMDDLAPAQVGQRGLVGLRAGRCPPKVAEAATVTVAAASLMPSIA
jgi:hypothetical protein